LEFVTGQETWDTLVVAAMQQRVMDELTDGWHRCVKSRFVAGANNDNYCVLTDVVLKL